MRLPASHSSAGTYTYSGGSAQFRKPRRCSGRAWYSNRTVVLRRGNDCGIWQSRAARIDERTVVILYIAHQLLEIMSERSRPRGVHRAARKDWRPIDRDDFLFRLRRQLVQFGVAQPSSYVHKAMDLRRRAQAHCDIVLSGGAGGTAWLGAALRAAASSYWSCW